MFIFVPKNSAGENSYESGDVFVTREIEIDGADQSGKPETPTQSTSPGNGHSAGFASKDRFHSGSSHDEYTASNASEYVFLEKYLHVFFSSSQYDFVHQ